jgi:hypothetical protein
MGGVKDTGPATRTLNYRDYIVVVPCLERFGDGWCTSKTCTKCPECETLIPHIPYNKVDWCTECGAKLSRCGDILYCTPSTSPRFKKG